MGRYSEIIEQARRKQYKSSKAFWREKSPGCSYAQYILIEKGKDLPLPKLAAQIARLLDLPIKKAMFNWAYDYMPEQDLKDIFMDLNDDYVLPDPSEVKVLATNSPPLVINRMQAQALVNTPILLELLLFLNLASESDQTFSPQVLSAHFKKPLKDMNALLNELYNYGFIEKKSNGDFYTKLNIAIPKEPDLEDLQRLIFQKSIAMLDDVQNKNARIFRATLTRSFTEEQVDLIEQRFKSLRNWAWCLPVKKDLSSHFTIGIFGAPRRFS